MPTFAQKRRYQEVKEFFRDQCVPKGIGPDEARETIQKKWSIDNALWYRLRVQLYDLQREVKGRNGQPPVTEVASEEEPGEIALPINLPEESKDLLTKLMDDNKRLAQSVVAKDVEIATQRGEKAALVAKNRLLLAVVEKLLPACS